jgi:hypothetical protein
MQRLFSAFPAGRPGLGLLLLRAATGVALATVGAHGALALADRSAGAWQWAEAGTAIVSGVLLFVGLLTPLA